MLNHFNLSTKALGYTNKMLSCCCFIVVVVDVVVVVVVDVDVVLIRAEIHQTIPTVLTFKSIFFRSEVRIESSKLALFGSAKFFKIYIILGLSYLT